MSLNCAVLEAGAGRYHIASGVGLRERRDGCSHSRSPLSDKGRMFSRTNLRYVSD
jgi:hypothetical protein